MDELLLGLDSVFLANKGMKRPDGAIWLSVIRLFFVF